MCNFANQLILTVCLGKGKVEALLDWKFVQSNLPWGVVLLMGMVDMLIE